MPRVPRFVFTPRWIALSVFALVVAGTCVRLGIWQLDRLEQRRALNDQIRAGLAAAPSTPDDLSSETDEPDDLAYRRMEITGTYDTGHEVLLYGRALDGRPGHHALTPLVYDAGGNGPPGGAAILVDRGWVPFELDVPPIPQAAPPSGPVTVTGFLVPAIGGSDAVIDRGPSGAVLTVRHADPATQRGDVPYELWPLALQLQEQSPPQSGDLPAIVPPPELDEGPHRSYAVQWFTFATIAAIGYVVLVVREAKDRARGRTDAEVG
jgi:surfeit locus 1 family protein